MRKTDLTGRRFGRLTVLGEHPERYYTPGGKPVRQWLCRCDCGKEVIIRHNSLTSGDSTSCGCLHRERVAKPKQDLTGRRFGRLTVLGRAPLDRKRVNGEINGWLCRCDCGTERVLTTKSLISNHAQSCGCGVGESARRRVDVDNVLGRYDGTVVSAIRPDRPANSNSKSGIKGVHWSPSQGVWVASITVRRRNITLYRGSSMEEAVKARTRAEETYFTPIIDRYDRLTESTQGQAAHEAVEKGAQNEKNN